MPPKKPVALKSKQWSCGDLAKGNKNVLKAKQEVQEKEETDDEDLGNQIEAC